MRDFVEMAMSKSPYWAMEQQNFATVLTVLQRQNGSDEYVDMMKTLQDRYAQMQAQYSGVMLEGASNTYMLGNIAVIPVIGSLMPRADMFTEISGATSVKKLQADFELALDSPDVAGILFDHDSPGGAVTGIANFASKIYTNRNKKPMMAYASGDMCSASYWLGAAVGNSKQKCIYASATSRIGSIGVVSTYTDMTRAEENAGVKRYEIVSTGSERKRLSPDTSEGMEAITDQLNAVYGEFVNAVSRYRGVSQQTVKDDFGRGGVFVGKQAVAAGLVDGVATFDEVVNIFSSNFIG